MSDLLVIGYGNPLCGDDGVAWRVIAAVESLLPEGTAVAIHQLTPEWAEAISEAALVVFVDAAVGNNQGEVGCLRVEPKIGQPGSHELTAEGLLSMATVLFGRCPPAYIVTIVGKSFEISESLTVPVAKSVSSAAQLILELVDMKKAPDPL